MKNGGIALTIFFGQMDVGSCMLIEIQMRFYMKSVSSSINKKKKGDRNKTGLKVSDAVS